MSKKMSPGREVQLGQYGPPMIIVDVGTHTGMVLCRWIAGDGKVQESLFAPSTLYDYVPPPDGNSIGMLGEQLLERHGKGRKPLSAAAA